MQSTSFLFVQRKHFDSLGLPRGVLAIRGWLSWLLNHHTLSLLSQYSGKSPFSIPCQDGPWFLRARTPNAALTRRMCRTVPWTPRKRLMGGRASPCSLRLCSDHMFHSAEMGMFRYTGSLHCMQNGYRLCRPERRCSHGNQVKFRPITSSSAATGSVGLRWRLQINLSPASGMEGGKWGAGVNRRWSFHL